MFPILLTTTSEKQPDAVVAWDSLAGNPIVTFTGEPAQKATLHSFHEGVICASAKKPLLQIWNFQNTVSNYKRILTKRVVNAIAVSQDQQYIFVAFDHEVYVYQCSSGCLVGLLDGSHSAKIGLIKLASQVVSNPPLLVTADVSGFMACWSLGNVLDTDRSLPLNANALTRLSGEQPPAPPLDEANTPPSNRSPLWYVLQASHGLPRVDFMENILLVAGSEGLKVYNLFNGCLMGATLTESVGGLHSLAAIQHRGLIYSGSNDGVVHTSRLCLPQNTISTSQEPRRCFVDSNLSSTLKAVTELATSPFDADLLFVGCRGGLIEVLRTNALLTSLRQFSVLHPSSSAVGSTATASSSVAQLTSLCLVPRPDWLCLARRSSSDPVSCNIGGGVETVEETDALPISCGLEPLKHYFGCRIDDTVRVRLLASAERSSTSFQQADVFLDDFLGHSEPSHLEVGSSRNKETTELENKVETLTAANRELLRRLIDFEMKAV